MPITIRYIPKTRIEQLIAFLGLYCSLHRITLTSTNIELMACLIEYGISTSTRDFVIDQMKLFKTKGQYRNGLTALKKGGLLTKEEYRNGYKIIKDFQFDLSGDIDMAIRIEKAKL